MDRGMRPGQGQTLIDVAVELGGRAEASWAIAMRSGVGLTDDVSGMELDVPSVAADPETAEAMAAYGAKPACDGAPEQADRKPIGTAIIGRDMI